jgi:hypothetical protein
MKVLTIQPLQGLPMAAMSDDSRFFSKDEEKAFRLCTQPWAAPNIAFSV